MLLKQVSIVLVVLFFAVLVQAGGGRVFGVVAGEDGTPVAGARVELQRDISQYTLLTYTTDKGEYAFNDVPPGIYLVRALDGGALVGESKVEFMLPGNRRADIGGKE